MQNNLYTITARCFCYLFLMYLFAMCSISKKVTPAVEKKEEEIIEQIPVQPSTIMVQKEYLPLQKKYAHLLNVSPDSITNIKLYIFIDKWMNTPYKWGGMDEKGIDCSAFLQRLFYEVYDIKLPRTSIEQLLSKYIEAFRSTQYLSEGDILFFRTMEDKFVSHVGFYLKKNMFVNSSSSKGVSFGNLNDYYWKKRFVAAGRVNISLAKK